MSKILPRPSAAWMFAGILLGIGGIVLGKQLPDDGQFLTGALRIGAYSLAFVGAVIEAWALTWAPPKGGSD